MTPSQDLHPTTDAANALAQAQAHLVAYHLAQCLTEQLDQLRRALMVRPWQVPELRDITRLLESASRAAFDDDTVWPCLSHGGGLPGRALESLRPAGVRRAGDLIAQASHRLSLLSAEEVLR